MKVQFNRGALAEALGLLTLVTPSRTPKPILSCVKISAEGKKVHICATDLEVGIDYVIPEAKVEESGEVVVLADRLNGIVRESADEILSVKASDGTCKVTGSDSEFTIYGQKADQYPKVPSFDGKADMEISLDSLQSGIEQCLFATAKESSRYAINGVFWQPKGKKLLLVATDGRRLARCRVNLQSSVAEQVAKQGIIVPSKTMSLIAKLAGGSKEIVAVRFADNQILFNCGNVVISSNLVDGSFPKYEDIIPTDYDKKLSLSTEAVLSAVRRAALLTSEESRGIKLSVTKGNLVFSGRAPETGDARVNMPADYNGEPIDIGFNPQFLIDALRVMKTPDFEIELNEADRPGLLKSGPEFLYVLMPISLG